MIITNLFFFQKKKRKNEENIVEMSLMYHYHCFGFYSVVFVMKNTTFINKNSGHNNSYKKSTKSKSHTKTNI